MDDDGMARRATRLRVGGGTHERLFGPGDCGMRWLGLDALHLAAGDTWQGATGGDEAVLVLLGGRCRLCVQRGDAPVLELAAARADVFSDLPAAIYAPRRTALTVEAEPAAEVAIIRAPCESDLAAQAIVPAEVKRITAGASSWQREVRPIVPPGSPLSQRLIVGETLNPPGNWSGIPPHRHDRMAAGENDLDEFYLYRVSPADGYGVQLVYGEAQAEAHVVGNGDVLLMPAGYHPTVAAPGSTVYYLWALAGETKDYKVAIDPRFAWVSEAEAAARKAH